MDAVVSDKADGGTVPSEWEFSWDMLVFVLRGCLGVGIKLLSDFEVDYGSEENASIVHAALAVDKELQPDKVKRKMSLSEGILSVHFEAVEARFLRASFSAFVDILTLATKTIEEFGLQQKL